MNRKYGKDKREEAKMWLAMWVYQKSLDLGLVPIQCKKSVWLQGDCEYWSSVFYGSESL